MSTVPVAKTRHRRPIPARTLLMIPAGLSLLAGLNAALILLELPAPLDTGSWPEVHGMVLVLGFLGTLVALERAVALRRVAGYLSPLLLGLGSLLLLTGFPRSWGKIGLLLGMACLVGVYLPLWRRQRDHAVLVQLLGAGLGTGAAILWAGGLDIALLLPWLASFLVLTVAGERVELARITMGTLAGTRVLQLSWLLALAVVASLLSPEWGSVSFGVALVLLALWLAAHDVARKTIRSSGAPRFLAACMLGGYVWLLVGGVAWSLGFPAERAAYDTVIHAVFLGFAMSMVIAHSSTILPAILRRPLPYRRVIWVPALLLHAGLLLRIWIGNGLGRDWAWQAGGVLNIVALLLFLALAILGVMLGEPEPRPGNKPNPKPNPAGTPGDDFVPGIGLQTRPGQRPGSSIPVREPNT